LASVIAQPKTSKSKVRPQRLLAEVFRKAAHLVGELSLGLDLELAHRGIRHVGHRRFGYAQSVADQLSAVTKRRVGRDLRLASGYTERVA
jgi:hypothetical protein